MSLPFIGSVLDTLGSKRAGVSVGCKILTSAIAPEVGIGTPSGLLGRLSRHFLSVLTAYQNLAVDRQCTEDLIYRTFVFAAARDFSGLENFLLGTA